MGNALRYGGSKSFSIIESRKTIPVYEFHYFSVVTICVSSVVSEIKIYWSKICFFYFFAHSHYPLFKVIARGIPS